MFVRGAEVGVLNGRTSDYLLGAIPDLELYCVDPWSADYDDTGQRPQDFWDAHYELVCERLAVYGERAKIMRCTSEEASGRVPDASLHFVFIDSQHTYIQVKRDLHLWAPKVILNGLIFCHDVDNERFPGVRTAFEEFIEERGYSPLIRRSGYLGYTLRGTSWTGKS